MNKEEIENQRQEEENYLNECGNCPNCGSFCHTSEMGNEGGTICCKNCYKEVRNKIKI